MKPLLRPPLTFYGGKQKLSSRIVELIPKHNLYCEPFFGGGAVFFAKAPSPVEIINDTNGELINFYKVLKTNFKKLEKEINYTLQSRQNHQSAKIVSGNPELFSEVKRAWATWTLANESFGSMLGTTWRCDFTKNTSAKRLDSKRNHFTQELEKRLKQTQIDCRDALYLIKSSDRRDTFFYLDPPYFNSNQGTYRGYKEMDFENLLILLTKIKGKFLLSSYPSPLLEKYTKQQEWFTQKLEMPVSIPLNRKGNPKMKTEVLTGNYSL